jgi:hypothetical protein
MHKQYDKMTPSNKEGNKDYAGRLTPTKQKNGKQVSEIQRSCTLFGPVTAAQPVFKDLPGT